MTGRTDTDLADLATWVRERGGATGPEVARYLRARGLSRQQGEYTARQLRRIEGVRYVRAEQREAYSTTGYYLVEGASLVDSLAVQSRAYVSREAER